MRLRRFGVLIAVLAASIGSVDCGSSAGDPAARTSLPSMTLPWEFSAAEQEIMVAVLDDTRAGAALRDWTATTFDIVEAMREASCVPGRDDPAAWHPVDTSVVIVHPSAPDGLRYSSPSSDPRLRLRSNQPSSAELALWSAAVHEAVTAHQGAAGAPFRVLVALRDAYTLLGGERSAVSSEEHLLVASLPPDGFAHVGLAAATEDQSEGDPESYHLVGSGRASFGFFVVPLAGTVNGRTVFNTVTVPRAGAAPVPQPVRCRGSGPATPRFAAWLGTDAPDAKYWPCDDLFPPEFAPTNCSLECTAGPGFGCQSSCFSAPIPVDPNGRARCRVEATYEQDEPCPAADGWLELVDTDLSRPNADNRRSADVHVCEVRQLKGAPLAACRSSLSCEGCEPGWCVTDVPELLHPCPSGRESTSRFRFVMGAGRSRQASGHIVCDAVSSP